MSQDRQGHKDPDLRKEGVKRLLRRGLLATTGWGTRFILFGIAAAATFAFASQVYAREIRATILQQKLGRLYFSAGKEDDIWPGCMWRVYRDSIDTTKPVCEGKIAESYEGVSISDSLSAVEEPLQNLLFAVVEIPERDTGWCRLSVEGEEFLNTIRATSVIKSGTILVVATEGVPPVWPSFQRDFTSQYWRDKGMAVADASLQLDALIGYSPCPRDEKPSLSHSASFLVALIPNISHPINRNALLTTALRYRIDTSQINNAFEFESVPQLSFLPGAQLYSAFTADISKAKKLLKENKTAGATVSIDTYSPTLQSTSKFIRGTLAQAGYTTTTVGWNEPADLRLAILPIYSDSPWVALREVLTSIAGDTVEKDRANQPVRLANRLLDDAVHTSDTLQRTRLLERVDRIFMEDIGAFPLFRPIIHVCAKEEIRGIKFDKDGRLDLRSIYRLKLPEDYAEAKR